MSAPIGPHNSQNYPKSARNAGSVNCVHGFEHVRLLMIELHALGVKLSIDADGRLAFDAPTGAMTTERLARLRADRETVLALVERIEERAAMVEHDGGMIREDAERLAWSEIAEGGSTLQTVSPENPSPPAPVSASEPETMPLGIRCPFCPSRLYAADPRGSRCCGCGRLCYLWMPNGSIVRADYENVALHSFRDER
jgi:hypothetical protein